MSVILIHQNTAAPGMPGGGGEVGMVVVRRLLSAASAQTDAAVVNRYIKAIIAGDNHS